MELGRPLPAARFAVVHAENGWTTSMPISWLFEEDSLFAYRHSGVPLDAEHGFLLRLVIPRLYAWKSAKWVRAVELVEYDRPGFWERTGYHAVGDPWPEQRRGIYLRTGHSSEEIALAAAGTAEIVLAEIRLMVAVGVRDRIEDILITLGSRYHLVRLVRSYPAFYLYLVLNRDRANLGMDRIQLAEAEETLVLEHQRNSRSGREDESPFDELLAEAAN